MQQPAKPCSTAAPSRRRFSQADVQNWITLMRGGMTIAEVSREIGVSLTTIRTRIRGLGFDITDGRLVHVPVVVSTPRHPEGPEEPPFTNLSPSARSSGAAAAASS